MRIAKEGLGLILFLFALGLIFLMFSLVHHLLLIFSAIMFVSLIFTIFFFRDPDRDVGKGIVSPADGKIIKIDEMKDSDIGDSIRISIFMSIFDVHINRMPMDGKIIDVKMVKGGFSPAFSGSAENNNRNVILVNTDIGKIKIVQISGIFARRIVCHVKKGDVVKKGERIGMIKFGSRVDLFLPRNKVNVEVKVGDKVKAGVDKVAEVNV